MQFPFRGILLDERFVFFHRADREFEWEEFSDLSDTRLASMLGYSCGPEFDAAFEAGDYELDTSGPALDRVSPSD